MMSIADAEKRLRSVSRRKGLFPGFEANYREPGNIEKAYRAGIIPMSKLEDGAYYFGYCRNAEFARWDSNKQIFIYLRHKFGDAYEQSSNPIERDENMDLFFPVAMVDPADGAILSA